MFQQGQEEQSLSKSTYSYLDFVPAVPAGTLGDEVTRHLFI